MNARLMFKRDVKDKNESVNIVIDRFLPRKDEYPKKIHKAMRHTLFAGGKRLRPYLMIKSFSLFSKKTEQIIEIAAALELIHTYTLIHDDLPEIDNDDFRRGKPTCHVVFGNELALLAGDALLVNALELLSRVKITSRMLRKVIAEITNKCGAKGLIAGQMADILNEGAPGTKEMLNFIHLNKTVNLFMLCTKVGAIVAKAKKDDIMRMEEYGYCLGMAFQIVDDILDIEGEQETLGKTVGKDQITKKLTYPALYGLENSKLEARSLLDKAHELLEPYGEKAFYLKMMNEYIIKRKL